MEITAVEIDVRNNPLLNGSRVRHTTVVTITLSDGSRRRARIGGKWTPGNAVVRANALWSRAPQIFSTVA